MFKKFFNKVLLELSYYSGRYLFPPKYINLILTFKCNFKCQSCSIWKKTDFSEELSDKQWLEVVNELKSFLPKDSHIELNGGEVLIRKSLVLRLIKKLKRYFDEVSLNTNGLLINDKVASELDKARLDRIKISFYSLDKKER